MRPLLAPFLEILQVVIQNLSTTLKGDTGCVR